MDILSYPELIDGTICLMDIAEEPLKLMTGYAAKLVKQNGFKAKIESTTDRREALKDANYVIVAIRVGGAHSMQADKILQLNTELMKRWVILPDPGASFMPHVTFH